MPVADVVMILGAVGALVTVIAAAYVSIKKMETVKAELKEDVQAVHKIVNQQRTDMLAYQKTLVDSLVAAGIHVPRDESLLKE